MREIGDVVSINSQDKMITNAKGDIKANSPMNVLVAFKADDQLSIYLKHNDFSQEHELLKDIKIGNTLFKKGELPSNFDSVVKVYFESVLGVAFSNQAMLDGMETFFSERSYNPVIEYMERAAEKWDGRNRIDRMLQVYLGAEDNPLISKIAQMWLVGAVAKVYDPYVKFDYVLDLVGGQGVGKTSLLQKLGGEWYTDAVTDFSNKDNYDIMLKSLIVNDDEMVASKKASFSELKKFITETKLEYRPPYASSDRRLPKSFIIVRATNDHDYLNDLTGERRFLVAEVHKDTTYKGRKWTEKDRRAFWGAMVVAWKSNQSLTLTDEQENLVNEVRSRYKFADETLEDLERYLALPFPKNMYHYPVTDRTRYYYIYDMMNEGYFRNSKGGTVELDTDTYGELVERDKMTINLFFQEVYLTDKAPPKDKAKVKKYMQNKEGWEHKRSLKFGKSVKPGYSKPKR